MKERLLKILELKNLTASQLADRLGVQRSGISHVLSGRNKPSIDFLQKLIKAYPDIDLRWLISGKVSENNKSHQPDLFAQGGKETAPMEKADIKDDEPVEYKSRDLQHQNKKTDKRAEKIVIFYSDHTFEVYHPDGK